jgi:hypothetical protein
VSESVVFGRTGEPPDADPHVRWCGRGWANPGPYPIAPQPESLTIDEGSGGNCIDHPEKRLLHLHFEVGLG